MTRKTLAVVTTKPWPSIVFDQSALSLSLQALSRETLCPGVCWQRCSKFTTTVRMQKALPVEV